MADPASTPSPQHPPNTIALTPAGTPIVVPGAPKPQGALPTFTPEQVQAVNAALNALPPGFLSAFIKRYWQVLLGLLLPLLLTTYQSAKEILYAPLTQITESATKDRKAVEEVKTQLDAMQKKASEVEVKMDKILWILNQRSGAASSGPSF
jgi:hypothetical protein